MTTSEGVHGTWYMVVMIGLREFSRREENGGCDVRSTVSTVSAQVMMEMFNVYHEEEDDDAKYVLTRCSTPARDKRIRPGELRVP